MGRRIRELYKLNYEEISGDDRNIEFLKNIYFFHAMPEASLRKILALCTEKIFEPASILFFEDMPGDCFFVILEGELEIWKRFGQKSGVLLGISGKGQPLGEMALIDDQPRSATVRSRTRARVLVIQAADFNNLLSSDNNICVSLLRAVTMMVRRSNEAHIADLDRQNKELARAYEDLKVAQDELLSRERLSIVGRFSSLILHDIRNPLSALKSRVELLEINSGNRDYCEQSLQKIKSDVSRMETIAAEFLDYVRGEIRLRMSVCNINILFERLRESVTPKAEQSGVALVTLCLTDRPVVLDEDRILRVLINCAENACNAMPDGGTLSVKGWTEGEPVQIEETYTGCGVSEEVLSHIFEPFYSASPVAGTGLGMVIIKSIVDAHHGQISITSSQGSGTRLLVSIPAIM
mgnify:CR=1 FL=1